MEKNIVIIGVNFYPEDSSTGLYTTQMALYLKEKGFNVSVITGFPYYPQWEIWENYKEKPKYVYEELYNVKIYRFKQYTPKNPNLINRIKHMLSFTLGNIKNVKKIDKADLVIAIVPFTLDIGLAKLLSKRTNSKIWVHIQDFEFDAAFESGVIKKKYKILKGLLNISERYLLNQADIISTISHSMVEKAKKKLTTDKEIFFFPNWIDEDFINPDKSKTHPYLSSEKFKILYSGNIGAKQDWDMFVKIVEKMKNDENIEFIIVGEGAKKDWVLKRIKNLRNVKYYKPVPFKELSDLLCSADLHILIQKTDVIDTLMPSKLLGMMASKKPSIVVGNINSEIRRILNESKGGKFFEKNNIDEIISFIRSLSTNENLKETYGKNAREYITKHFSKKAILKKFENKIEEILK